jgi:TolA-binding protein
MRGAAVVGLAVLASGCGVFATQKDYDTLATKNSQLEKSLEEERAQTVQLRTDLDATRTRLDNALRANADNGSDLMTSKARINDLAGKVDELGHNLESVGKDVAASRRELDARLDEMKRAQPAAPPPPPVVIPPDRKAHLAAIEAASAKKDWGLVRTLGHEYADRYPTDEQTDSALYLIGDGDLQDGRPSSALGEYNRILKQFPRSNILDKTLFGMGEAYLVLHDCVNAKLAFSACESRFGKAKVGQDAKRRLQQIDKPPPGMCAPP